MGACLSVVPTNVFSETIENLLHSSVEQKKAHVLRYYDKCRSQNKSDEVCRKELEELHPREMAALNRILGNAGKYDQFELSRTSAECYDPSHDYKDLIECWEGLAGKMEAGGNIKKDEGGGQPPDGIYEGLKDLTPFEQKSVILCVRGTISNNYRDTVAPNLQKGGDNALWALKINGFESVQISELASAANWVEMDRYYKTEATNVENLVRGQTSFDTYKLASKQNSGNLKQALEPEMTRQPEHARNFQQFASLCRDISSTIIAKAKAAASN